MAENCTFSPCVGAVSGSDCGGNTRDLHLIELDGAPSGIDLHLIEFNGAASGHNFYLVALDGAANGS